MSSTTNQKMLAVFGLLALVTMFAVAAGDKAKGEVDTEETPVVEVEAPTPEPEFEWQLVVSRTGKKASLSELRATLDAEETKVTEAFTVNMVEEEGNWFAPDLDSKSPVFAQKDIVFDIAKHLRRQARLVVRIRVKDSDFSLILTRLTSSEWDFEGRVLEEARR